jgi:hypothetical protein
MSKLNVTWDLRRVPQHAIQRARSEVKTGQV